MSGQTLDDKHYHDKIKRDQNPRLRRSINFLHEPQTMYGRRDVFFSSKLDQRSCFCFECTKLPHVLSITVEIRNEQVQMTIRHLGLTQALKSILI